MDEHRKSGLNMGPLHGIPVGLKDIIDTRSMPTERGTRIFSGRQPDNNAFIVQKLLGAGAVILGKTVTTELAFVHANETRNPHNLARSPGGSSSGSAAAVAAFHVPLAVGTQTNGSVIRPASYCGIYGVKPTNGVISRTGLLKTSQSLDQVGVFARTLEDAALLVDAMAGHDENDVNSFAHPPPILSDGVNSEAPVEPIFASFELPFDDRLSADARKGFEEILEALGKRVEKHSAPPAFKALLQTQATIHHYEICHHLEEVFDNHWPLISDTLKPIIEQGRLISRSNTSMRLEPRTKQRPILTPFLLTMMLFWHHRPPVLLQSLERQLVTRPIAPSGRWLACPA